MTITLFKSIMSLVLFASAVVAMYSMLEVLGSKASASNIDKLKRLHRVNGSLFFIVYSIAAFFCLRFIFITRAELSARSALHSLFALFILILMAIKSSYVRRYSQFYPQVRTIGMIMALLAFGVTATSGGYYILVSRFGTDASFDKIMQYQAAPADRGYRKASGNYTVRTDPESIGRGNNIFDAKCSFCHNAYSTETVVGPGLKGILQRKSLPFSRRKAVPDNIIRQLRDPVNRMPSFNYLSEEEIADIVAFLNTL